MALSTNLISYWKLDGNNTDSAGNNTATDTSITYGAGNGIIGQGISLNGTSSKIVITENTTLGLNTFSTSCWFNVSNTSAFQPIISRRTSFFQGFMVYVSGGNINADVCDGADNVVSTAIAANTWYHVVLTYDNATKTMKMYLNAGTPATKVNTNTIVNSGALNIGFDVPNATFYYGGKIDEIGIWSRVLTTGEISQLYNSGFGNQFPFYEAKVKVLTVAGGGAGGGTANNGGGGGGAGEVNYNTAYYIGSGAKTVTVGNGGTGVANAPGGNGQNSVFDAIVATGGGGGGSGIGGSNLNGQSGGSGGGGGGTSGTGGTSTKGVNGFGNSGATGNANGSAGGGGAGAAGNASPGSSTGGSGGAGVSNSISGAAVTYGGGGGGGYITGGAGGTGGGGAGESYGVGNGGPGTANTGGGGGGVSRPASTAGYSGGSGIVIISYATDGSDGISPSSTGGTITTSGGQTIHTFTSSGTFTMIPTGTALYSPAFFFFLQ